jgi:hypothetical protein
MRQITFPDWFWQYWNPTTPVSQSILISLVVRIYGDGAVQPAVEGGNRRLYRSGSNGGPVR